MQKLEYCCQCNQVTGRAGRGEDSLYAADGTPAELGPLCPTCYETLTHESELETLKAQLMDATGTLKDIGDFAHDRSTGPAVEDDLWEVRRMAYELLTPNA